MLPSLLGLLLTSQSTGRLGTTVESPRSFATGNYRNLFREIGKTDAEINTRIQSAWNQLFYGDDATQRIYYPVGTDMAYIKDVGNNDVRSEGMSYGMMVAVQLNHQEEFDRLWRWSDKYMRYKTGPYKGYFAWQLDTNGTIKGTTPASDGEEYFAMALYFAAGRWGSKGKIAYRKEADSILHSMLHREGVKDEQRRGTMMFDPTKKMVVFCPVGDAAKFTDASYHLPAFYELWSRWAATDRPFWKDAAKVSRAYWKKAIHPVTGLASDCSTFEGVPLKLPWDANSMHHTFASDSFRVAGNIAMDYAWFGVDPWQVTQSERMLSFFNAQNGGYLSGYTVDGSPTATYQAAGHAAMNATAALAAPPEISSRYVRALWSAPTPSGQWRYYDGMLTMFSLLHASGQYRIYTPQ